MKGQSQTDVYTEPPRRWAQGEREREREREREKRNRNHEVWNDGTEGLKRLIEEIFFPELLSL
jgi:hypothetical protein